MQSVEAMLDARADVRYDEYVHRGMPMSALYLISMYIFIKVRGNEGMLDARADVRYDVCVHTGGVWKGGRRV